MKTSGLKKIVKGMAGKRVIVLGDLMVDEYIFGETYRISREAPVLILKYRGREAGYGGAANAVANIRAMGGAPLPVSCVGDDENGRTLIEMLKKDGISTDGIIVNPGISTTSKTRIMAGGMHTIRQQVIRIDREPESPHDPAALIRATGKFIDDGADGLLVSDYGTGCLSRQVISYANSVAKSGKIRVAVDSRYQLKFYRYADLLAPNEEEAGIHEGHGADDLKSIEAVCEKLRAGLRSRALLVTRGSEGLSLFVKDRKAAHIPVYGSRSAVDTTGAGDTVVSVALLSICAGGGFLEAAHLSNRAGGLVVMKKGAATVSPEELTGTL